MFYSKRIPEHNIKYCKDFYSKKSLQSHASSKTYTVYNIWILPSVIWNICCNIMKMILI